jgi:hypothetical protein
MAAIPLCYTAAAIPMNPHDLQLVTPSIRHTASSPRARLSHGTGTVRLRQLEGFRDAVGGFFAGSGSVSDFRPSESAVLSSLANQRAFSAAGDGPTVAVDWLLSSA